MRISLVRIIACFATLVLCGVSAARQQQDHEHAAALDSAAREQPWSKRVVELAESLPVQDGGRIKPLSTYAGFTLLRLNGKRSVTTPAGEKLSPTEWVLDMLFFPESAAHYEMFLVQDSDVIEAIGLKLEGKKKRDRYSYDELAPGIRKLFQLADSYLPIEEKLRTSLQSQIVNLAGNVDSFAMLSAHETFAIVPPTASRAEQESWLTLAEVARNSSVKGKVADEHAALLGGFQAMVEHSGEPARFEQDLADFHARAVGLAEKRGEYGKIGMEIDYYKADLLTWSQTSFLIAFLAMAFMWLRPKNNLLHRTTALFALAGTLLLVAAIVMRCMIRGRPPVSTLYETVLFVTAVGALVALAAEWLNRQRIAVSAAAILGLVGLFIANGYETLDKQDTMPSLVAVLDTNFWLATHVTAVTVGYSAGLLAALLGSLYLIAKIVRIKRDDPGFFRTLSRMTYGVLCFGVIFSTIGTILGGIWANESWGRFWGWDPKENGALLIVLTQLVILHGRMGGYLREFGVCMAAAFCGTVVAFSWWGVNLLGVGLHSYGFTSGIQKGLWIYYGTQWGIVALGGLQWLLARSAAQAPAPSSPRSRDDRRGPAQLEPAHDK